MNTMDPTIPADVSQAVASEIDADEKIVWAAQPIPGKLARQAIPIVLFGIPWTAFSLFWMGAAGFGTLGFTTTKAALPFSIFGACFVLWGLPFVLVGLGMLSSPYWIARKAKRTVYVVTNRRAIIFESSFWKSAFTIRSFNPDKLGDLRRKQNSDGSGNLVFACDWSNTSGGSRRSTDVGFLAVPNVKEAEDRVRELAHTGDELKA